MRVLEVSAECLRNLSSKSNNSPPSFQTLHWPLALAPGFPRATWAGQVADRPEEEGEGPRRRDQRAAIGLIPTGALRWNALSVAG